MQKVFKQRIVTGALVLGIVACENMGENRVLSIDLSSTVQGFVYFDADGSRDFNVDEDELQEGVSVSLVVRGSDDTVATAVSDGTGNFQMASVLTGLYDVVVDPATVGDSAQVIEVDSATINLAQDTLSLEVLLSFPLLPVAEVRSQALGEKIFVEGIALNTAATFGDSTVHVVDTSGTLRATRVGVGVTAAGDSVRFRGTVSSRDGERTLDDVDVFSLGSSGVPAPEVVTTQLAADADSVRLSAALVAISGAVIEDTVTVGGDLIITLNDGSGPLDVVLDGDVSFPIELFLGTEMDVVGLLVPAGAGTRQLKPRSDADVDTNVSVVTIAEARLLGAGEVVVINGVALNDRDTFGDSTIHLIDITGSIRLTTVQPAFILEGDSIRVLGTVSALDGQPTVDDVTPFLISSVLSRLPQDVDTDLAAIALGGRLDAALVRVTDATVSQTATVPDGVEFTVNDGTGDLVVLLDEDVGFTTAITNGNVITATGVLVPVGDGTWKLKPRGDADLTVN